MIRVIVLVQVRTSGIKRQWCDEEYKETMSSYHEQNETVRRIFKKPMYGDKRVKKKDNVTDKMVACSL